MNILLLLYRYNVIWDLKYILFYFILGAAPAQAQQPYAAYTQPGQPVAQQYNNGTGGTQNEHKI